MSVGKADRPGTAVVRCWMPLVKRWSLVVGWPDGTTGTLTIIWTSRKRWSLIAPKVVLDDRWQLRHIGPFVLAIHVGETL